MQFARTITTLALNGNDRDRHHEYPAVGRVAGWSKLPLLQTEIVEYNMYAMSSDPFVRSLVRSPVMLAIEQCAQSDFTVSRRYAATRSGEGRGKRGEAAKGTSAKPAPSPSLLSPIESRLARLGARCSGSNVLGGCAEYLASKQASEPPTNRQLPSSMQERCETPKSEEVDID